MIVNVEQSSFSGVVLNVSRLVGIREIIGSKVSAIGAANILLSVNLYYSE